MGKKLKKTSYFFNVFKYIIMSLGGQAPSFLETFFVDPDCVDDVYEEENEDKWINCAMQRGYANFVSSGIIVAIIVLILMIFLGNLGRFIAVLVGAAIIGSTYFFGYVAAERRARAQFVSSRKELEMAGYSEKIQYASEQEKIEKRAAAIDKLRRERLAEQQIAAISSQKSSTGTAAASFTVGAIVGSLLDK
jgi:hypothetical protein